MVLEFLSFYYNRKEKFTFFYINVFNLHEIVVYFNE